LRLSGCRTRARIERSGQAYGPTSKRAFGAERQEALWRMKEVAREGL
jgi:hypothetical protein